MERKRINRLRIMLAEKNITNRWLADHIAVTEGTVSKWVTNTQQPSLTTLHKIADLLKVDIRELIEPTHQKK